MSLIAWYPLNGNLNNNGCSGTVWKTSTATVNSAGKIGSCYNLAATSGNGIYLDTNSMSVTDFLAKYINNHSWSIMGWFKTTTTANLTPLWCITYGLRLYVGSKLKVWMKKLVDVQFYFHMACYSEMKKGICERNLSEWIL